MELDMIGRGSQGTLYTVRHVSTSEVFVMKRIRVVEQQARRAALREAQLLQLLQHTAVVAYRDCFVLDDCLCIVMEHCAGADLGRRISMAHEPFTEEQVLQEGTFIKVERFDFGGAARALPGQSAAAFKQWGASWAQLSLEGLHGFPLWEEEVHDLLQRHFETLSSAFGTYSKSPGEAAGDAAAQTMSTEELHDFVVNVGLETPEYKFEQMGPAFARANSSGKGAAGAKAAADAPTPPAAPRTPPAVPCARLQPHAPICNPTYTHIYIPGGCGARASRVSLGGRAHLLLAAQPHLRPAGNA